MSDRGTKRPSQPSVGDSGRSPHEVPCRTGHPAKRQRLNGGLYDIAYIANKRGDVEFYRERFNTWRRINNRDDPRQSRAAKENSWRPFVFLENKNRMDSLLGRGPNQFGHGSDDRVNATSRSHTRERRQERQPRGRHAIPKYRRSADNHATEHGRSDESVASFGGDSTESDGLGDQRSAQPTTGVLRENQSTEVGLNEKTIERLWKWKSAHREQIEELHLHSSDLATRCQNLEAHAIESDSCHDDLEAKATQASVSKTEFESRLQQTQDDVLKLQETEKIRGLSHARLLGAVEEAGSTLGTLRGDLETRLVALESVKDQPFDILQRLYAEKQLQSDELATLREQVETFRQQVAHLQRMK